MSLTKVTFSMIEGAAFNVLDYGADPTGVANSAAALTSLVSTDGSIYFPPGTYRIASNIDFGDCTLSFASGAILNVLNGVEVLIRKQVVCGNYKIFEQTGNIVVGGQVNPMWWGAIPYIEDLPTAQNNTIAFRKACKSFKSEYDLVVTEAICFNVDIPAGMFALANGFAYASGILVSGASTSSSYLKRMIPYFDPVETAIPLAIVGNTLNANLTLAEYSESALTNFDAPYPCSMIGNLYITDQNVAGAIYVTYAGVQMENLFLTSCERAIRLRAADLNANNIIIDMGLTGISIEEGSQNCAFSNINFFNVGAQCIVLGTNIRDIVFDNFVISYPQQIGIHFPENSGNMDNIRFSNGAFLMNAQFTTFLGMIFNRASNVNAFFGDCSFRNVYGPAFNVSLATDDCRWSFDNCVFDANRTSAGYDQGSTMSVATIKKGEYIFNSCQFKNMYNPFVTSFGPINLYVNGLVYTGTNLGATPQFNFSSGPGNAYLTGVVGNGAGTLSTGAGMTVNVAANFNT